MSAASRTLHQLIYASRIQVPWPDQAREVERIVQVSQANNVRTDLTGLLLVHDGWFVQALEGPTEAVLTTYGRITGDPRHADCRVLAAGPAERRAFADWSMCARQLTAADEAILDTLAMRGVFEPQRLSGAHALKLLRTVRGVQHEVELRKAG